MGGVRASIVDLRVEAVDTAATRRTMDDVGLERHVVADRRRGLEGWLWPVDLDVWTLPPPHVRAGVERVGNARGAGLGPPGVDPVVAHVEMYSLAAGLIDGPLPHASSVGGGSNETGLTMDRNGGHRQIRQDVVPGRQTFAGRFGP